MLAIDASAATLNAMLKIKIVICAIAVWVVGALIGSPAVAQNPRPIGSYGDWQALTFEEGGKSGCYVIAEPTRKEGNYTSRDDVYALVTHRPADDKVNVFTVIAGYTYQNESTVTLEVGDEKFSLKTNENTAWASDEDDPRIVDALKKGTGMVVRGVSSRGTETTDTYSLTGFT
ncbi:MAG: invasion associated locus B family protein, partial [Dongiaceae bacterium]